MKDPMLKLAMKLKISTLLLLMVASLVFSACFSTWEGDTAFITLNFGASARAVDPEVLSQLEHTVTLSGPSEIFDIPVAHGLMSVQQEVSPGHWDITVLAKLGEDTFAKGIASVEARAGRNNPVSVSMRPIAEPPVITVVFEDFGDETIEFTGGTSFFHGETLEVTVSGEYDSYQWYLDGVRCGNNNNFPNIFTYQCNSLGGHTLTVIVIKGDVPYSKVLFFEVVDRGNE
jgi:hypothetical protein